jgi:hypothetical protein
MEESHSVRPIAGRLLALDFRPARPLTLLGPAWAVLCGSIASGGLLLQTPTLLNLVLLLLLCDALLGAWRSLWLHADWRTALPRNLTNARIWSMTSSDTPSFFLQRWTRGISQRIRFLRIVAWPLIDSEITGMLVAGILALCVAVVLGQLPTILTVVALLLALIEGQLGVERGALLRAIFEIALPWSIAQSAFGGFSWLALVVIGLFTLMYFALLGLVAAPSGRWTWLSILIQFGVIGILIAFKVAAGAGIVALGLLAQVLWQARFRVERNGRAYAQHVQSYLMIEMLVVAIMLWFSI